MEKENKKKIEIEIEYWKIALATVVFFSLIIIFNIDHSSPIQNNEIPIDVDVVNKNIEDANAKLNYDYGIVKAVSESTGHPKTYEEAQLLIRPEEAKPYLKNFNLNKEKIQENLDKIMTSMKITYFHDGIDYWQTPEETLSKRRGDCEDWAIAKTSLVRAYAPVDCYVIVWQTHASVLCHIGNGFTIYDQGELIKNIVIDENPENESIITQENKINFRMNLNNYFKEYGIPSDERKIQTIFNEKELIFFEDNEDFINWALK